MRESSKSPATYNAYARGFNSFLTWLKANEYTTEQLRIKKSKVEKKVMKTFSDTDLKAIIAYRPKDWFELRTHTMFIVAFETGARINELLTLTKDRVDLDNMLITVHGKGNKQRIIPISVECRKILYKWLRKHKHSLVFSTRQGCKMLYDNTRKDFNHLLQKAGVKKTDGTWHALRRYFATNYIRQDGNPLKLQRRRL